MPEWSLRSVTTKAVIGSLLLVALVVSAMAVAMWSPPDAEAAVSLTAGEKKLVRLINKERVKRGRKALRVRRSLCRAADRHSRDMLRRDFFSHRSSNGRTVGSRVLRAGYRRSGYRRWYVGELLSQGRALMGTPEATVKMWMRSKSHRRVLLNRRWRDIGVGRRKGTFCGVRATIVTTVDFGRRIR